MKKIKSIFSITKEQQLEKETQCTQNLHIHEEAIAGAAKESLRLANYMSSFNIGMAHIANELIIFSESTKDLSESNLSIVEETTANMNEVSTSIDETSSSLAELTAESSTLREKNEQSKQLLQEALELKEIVIQD